MKDSWVAQSGAPRKSLLRRVERDGGSWDESRAGILCSISSTSMEPASYLPSPATAGGPDVAGSTLQGRQQREQYSRKGSQPSSASRSTCAGAGSTRVGSVGLACARASEVCRCCRRATHLRHGRVAVLTGAAPTPG